MKRLLFCFVLCLPLAFATAAEKKKKVALTPEQKAEQEKQEAQEREEIKKMRNEPPFPVGCKWPNVIGEEIVLQALHPLGQEGSPVLNEVILRLERSGGKVRAVKLTNFSYPANLQWERAGSELPMTKAGYYVWRYCYRRLPDHIRILLPNGGEELM